MIFNPQPSILNKLMNLQNPLRHPPLIHLPFVHPPLIHLPLIHPPLIHPPLIHLPLVHPPLIHLPLIHRPVIHPFPLFAKHPFKSFQTFQPWTAKWSSPRRPVAFYQPKRLSQSILKVKGCQLGACIPNNDLNKPKYKWIWHYDSWQWQNYVIAIKIQYFSTLKHNFIIRILERSRLKYSNARILEQETLRDEKKKSKFSGRFGEAEGSVDR